VPDDVQIPSGERVGERASAGVFDSLAA